QLNYLPRHLYYRHCYFRHKLQVLELNLEILLLRNLSSHYFPPIVFFLIGSKTLTKTIVLINYQLTVQKGRQKCENYVIVQSIVFVHDNYCFKKLIKTAQKNGSILLHDKNDFQKLVMHIEKEWFF